MGLQAASGNPILVLTCPAGDADCRRPGPGPVQSLLFWISGSSDESALYAPAPTIAPVIGARM